MVGGSGGGEEGAIEGDLDESGGVKDVDAFERVARVDVDWGVFFVVLVCGQDQDVSTPISNILSDMKERTVHFDGEGMILPTAPISTLTSPANLLVLSPASSLENARTRSVSFFPTLTVKMAACPPSNFCFVSHNFSS